ncbi:MAG: DUF2721 domain-containing protein [Gemmatimonadota bacterium]|nr:DUF2721 domain-containing protein [Gemmatimonadota bacterium]
MPEDLQLSAVVRAIELAIAPVFLVTGVMALLTLLTGRLSRVIDRARLLEGRLDEADPGEAVGDEAARWTEDLETLATRASLINRALGLATGAALMIGAVIAALFLGAFLGVQTQLFVGWMFIGAMALLILALVYFLREVFLATSRLQIGPFAAGRARGEP